MGSEAEHEEDEATWHLLRDRFRLSTISIAESQASQFSMEISPPIISCISDLAFKYAEILAKDVALFARHGGRKSVNMEDVILSVHRNENLASSMRSLSNDLKAKEPQSERRRKKAKKKDLVVTDEHVHHLHQNEHLASSMRSFSNDLKAKEPQSERRKRKKEKKEDLEATDVLEIPDP